MSGSAPLVTIGIPTRNRPEAFLRAALDSVVSQCMDDLEVLVSDDASTSIDVASVVASYHDDRITYHRHDPPLGLSGNWSWIVASAGGEWVTLLHDDDVMAPGALHAAMDVARRYPEVAVQVSRVNFVNTAGAPLGNADLDSFYEPFVPTDVPLYGPDVLWAMWRKRFINAIPVPAVIVRRDAYTAHLPFSAWPRFSTDMNMWVRLLSDGCYFLYRSDVGASYRVHDNQVSARQFPGMHHLLALLEYWRVARRASVRERLRFAADLPAVPIRELARGRARRRNS